MAKNRALLRVSNANWERLLLGVTQNNLNIPPQLETQKLNGYEYDLRTKAK